MCTCEYAYMHLYMHVPKKWNVMHFPAKYEVVNKPLHAHRAAEHKNHKQQTSHGDQREKTMGTRGPEEDKSLPLFRLVVAVVCCLVFPFWLSNHTSLENKTIFSWLRCLCTHIHTSMHRQTHTHKQLPVCLLGRSCVLSSVKKKLNTTSVCCMAKLSHLIQISSFSILPKCHAKLSKTFKNKYCEFPFLNEQQIKNIKLHCKYHLLFPKSCL